MSLTAGGMFSAVVGGRHLFGDEAVVEASLRHQVAVSAALRHSAVAHADDVVGRLDGRQSMSDDDRCPPSSHLTPDSASM